MQNKLENIKKLYQQESQEYNGFQSFDTAYLFTNENIADYIKDVKNKKILSIASSGDHYLCCLLNGATNIDLFDINYFSKIIIKLKRAIIENLDYKVFLDFFGIESKKKIFDYEIFTKIIPYLDEETYMYWKYIYETACFEGQHIYDSKLIIPYNYDSESLINAIPYLKEEEYIKLQQILYTIPKINFIHTDINEIDNRLTESYDIMFLSNISMYQKPTYFIKKIKKLSKHMNSLGKIYFAYIYNYQDSDYSAFYNQLLKSSKYESQIVKDSKRIDKIYIYKK